MLLKYSPKGSKGIAVDLAFAAVTLERADRIHSDSSHSASGTKLWLSKYPPVRCKTQNPAAQSSQSLYQTDVQFGAEFRVGMGLAPDDRPDSGLSQNDDALEDAVGPGFKYDPLLLVELW